MNTRQKPKQDSVNDTLAARQATHGCFIENGRIMQLLKESMETSEGWATLSPHQKEALQMIQHKVGRILSGNPNEPDHWKDVAGYAMLVHNILVYGKSHV